MRLVLSLIFLCTGISCSSLFNKDKESAQLYLNLGVSQLKQGHTAMALKSLLNAKKLNSDNEVIYNYLGLTYFTMKKYRRAVSNFENALAANSRYTEARNNLARALIETESYGEARSHLRLALADLTYTKHSLAYFNYGLSYFRENRYKSAVIYFQKAIKGKQKNCQAFSYYGRSLYELQDYNGATPIFDIALPLCKKQNFDEAHYYAALSYFKTGDRSRGISLMNETILHYPEGLYQKQARETLELMKLNRL